MPMLSQEINGQSELPAHFNGNRIFVQPVTEYGDTLNLLHDTGGGTIFVTREAVEKLDLEIEGDTFSDSRMELTRFPKFNVEDDIPWFPDSFSSKDALYLSEKVEFLNGRIPVMPSNPQYPMEIFGDGLLGNEWFATRIWTFDYLQDKLILHHTFEKHTAHSDHCIFIFFPKEQDRYIRYFPRIVAEIDGEEFSFLFDTGATLILSDDSRQQLSDDLPAVRGTSYITESVFQKWRLNNPEWKVIKNAEQFTGAHLIRVPEVTIAGHTVGPVWFTTRPDPAFRQHMSGMMDRQIEGALGGSLFQYFRITVNYQGEYAIFERSVD